MKVRVGIGAGPSRDDPAAATLELVDGCEARGIDSVWFPDRIAAPAIEPLVAMGWAVARTSSLKVGSGVDRPARAQPRRRRGPAGLPRRPGTAAASCRSSACARPPPPSAPPTRSPGPRAAVFEEALTVVRRLLTEESVTFHGSFFTLDDAVVAPRPARPLDLWLGGLVPAALRRVGRLGRRVARLVRHPRRGGRGTSHDRGRGRRGGPRGRGRPLRHEPPRPAARRPPRRTRTARARPSAHRRPEIDPRRRSSSTAGTRARRQVQRFVDEGITKFVVRPAVAPASWPGFLDEFAEHLVPLET